MGPRMALQGLSPRLTILHNLKGWCDILDILLLDQEVDTMKKPGLRKLTGKQELFALLVVEQKNKSEAYRNAYSTKNMAPETVWQNACREGKKPHVAARIEALQREYKLKHDVTIDDLQEKLQLAYTLGLARDKPLEMTNSVMAQAKLAGLLVDKVVNDGKVNITITRKFE